MPPAAIPPSDDGPVGTVSSVGLGRMGRARSHDILGKCGTDVASGSALEVPTEPADSSVTIVGDLLEGFIHRITVPRRILLVPPAGGAVGEVIATLLPFLMGGRAGRSLQLAPG